MAWRVANSLGRLLAQLNAAYPRRSKISDGAIGDAAHASRSSDHNPWVLDGATGIVTARDYTHDLASGMDCEALYQALIKSRDPRIKYVIWNRTITSGGKDASPWVRRSYTGSNPHDKHLHLSVRSDKASYDDVRDWALPGTASTPEVPDMLPHESAQLAAIATEVGKLAVAIRDPKSGLLAKVSALQALGAGPSVAEIAAAVVAKLPVTSGGAPVTATQVADAVVDRLGASLTD